MNNNTMKKPESLSLNEPDLEETGAFLDSVRISMANLEGNLQTRSRDGKRRLVSETRSSSAASLLSRHSNTSEKKSRTKRLFSLFARRNWRQRVDGDRSSSAGSEESNNDESSLDEELLVMKDEFDPVNGARPSLSDDNHGDEKHIEVVDQSTQDGEHSKYFSQVHTQAYADGLKGQHNQVCITVIEARQLAGLNMDPTVCIQIGTQKKYTSAKASTNCPYYNEYFVFEFHSPPSVFLDQMITLTVYQSKRLIGKSSVVGVFKLDVGTVYAQADHQFYQKWAVLTDPEDAQSGPRGYLKCTIGVCSKGETLKLLPQLDKDNDDIESNLLLPEGIRSQRQQARYVLRIFRAENLPRLNNGVVASVRKALSGDSSFCLIDPYVQVHFAGHEARTSVIKSTTSPAWNEQVVFTEMFPPLVRRMKLQLKDSAAMGSPVLATHCLDLTSISDEGRRGFLPTFGPCFVNMYGSINDYRVIGDKNAALNEGLGEGVAYKGRLLISLHVEVLNDIAVSAPGVAVCSCQPIAESVLGREEDFLLYGCIMDVSMLDRRLVEKPVFLQVSMGNCEVVEPSESDENLLGSHQSDLFKLRSSLPSRFSTPAMKPVANDENYARLPYGDEKPSVHVRGRWPDQRRRLYHSNLLRKIADNLRHNSQHVELRLKRGEDAEAAKKFQFTCDNAIQSCQHYQIWVKKCCGENSSMNKLDKERTRMCQYEVDRVSNQVRSIRSAANRSSIQQKLADLMAFADALEHLSIEPQDSLPDMFIWLIQQNKRVAYHRIPAKELIFSTNPQERGASSGVLQSFYLKLPGRQSNVEDLWRIQGQVTAVFWLGLNRARQQLVDGLPRGYASKAADTRDFENCDRQLPKCLEFREKATFQLRCHIFQARSLIGSDSTGLSDPFARIVFCGYSCTTQIVEQTINPTWDEFLHVPSVVIYGSAEHTASSPPCIVVELFDYDKMGKMEFIGQVVAKPVVKLAREKYAKPKFPPSLQWWSICRGTESAGELLAAFELLQIATERGESYDFPPLPAICQKDSAAIVPVPEYIRPILSQCRIEVLFWGLRDLKRINLVSVDRPRVDVEIAGRVISSVIINDYKKNPNFSVLTKSMDILLPDSMYWPPLVIRCVDCRNFGRFVLVGTRTINNIQRFMDEWNTCPSVEEAGRTSCTSGGPGGASVIVDVDGEPALLLTDSRYASDIVTKKKPSTTVSDNAVDDDLASLDWWSKYFASVEDSAKESGKSNKSALARTLESLEDPDFTKSLHANMNDKHARNSKKNNKKAIRPVGRVRSRENAKIAKLKIYRQELENVPGFDGFRDWLDCFDLYRGKRGADYDSTRCVGRFKGAIRISRQLACNEPITLFKNMPTNDPVPILVRVYIVKANDLHPSDLNGKADPYVLISLGKTKISDKQNYISKQLNPVFGKCFELEAVFPLDSQLCVQVFDWDLIGSDDLIGETWIDLENRFYSKHRAHCGLSESYETAGYNKWRDTTRPSQILTRLCKEHRLEGPFYLPGQVRVGSKTFLAPTCDTERLSGTKVNTEALAVHALRNWHDVPKIGCQLVPEHVETRALYHPDKPGIVQGHLEMWVDMFPTDVPSPGPPVDIAPRKPKSYELRVIIWNTEDVVLEDDALFTGEKMSDIYVKGWLKGPEDVQSTDVHYRSLTGEGNFNWRFIFPFDYLAAEEKLVISRKASMFSWDETEVKIPPRLELQVWDADHFSADDFLGSLTLELNNFPRGAKSAKQCTVDIMHADADAPTVNIFKQRRVKGWWPFIAKTENGELQLTGKVEAEIHLLTAEEAERNPVGFGRSEPDPLEKPNRPDSSFVWFINPLKSMRYILWHNYKWLIIKIFTAIALLLLLAIFIYSIPTYLAKRMLGA